MDDRDEKPKKPERQPLEPPRPEDQLKDPVGPPPDPRGTSDSTGQPLGGNFDPKSVEIEAPGEELVEGDKDPITEAGIEKPTPELQINKPQSRIKRLLKSKKLWFTLLFLLIAVLIALWFVQPTRAWIVNAIGLRVPVAVNTRTVAENGRPSAILQKAIVSLNGDSAESDDRGQARFDAKYGQVTIRAEKTGFEPAEYTNIYDFDPFFGLFGNTGQSQEQVLDLRLKSVGLPLVFKVVDWLTEQPVVGGDFEVGDVVTKSDEKGIVSIKVPPTDAKTVTVSAKFGSGYVNKEFDLVLQAEPVQQVAVVPAGKNYFISNRTGKLGIYRSDLDGSNVEQVVAPSDNETSAVDFSLSPSGKYGVLASSREGQRDTNNTVLQKLYVVNLDSGSLSAVDEGAWFDFADWSGDTLVYTVAATGGQRLASIDTTNNKKTDLSTAASYGQVRVSLGQAVYLLNHATGSSGAANNPELRVVSVNGGTEKNLGNKVQTVTQNDYDKVVFRADNTWRQYDLNTSTSSNASAPVSSNRVFLGSTSPNGQSRLLVDKVDGVNTLFIKSVATGEEVKLYANSALTKPIRWSGSFVIFRLADSTQTANYVVASGHNPKKIGDVSASTSPQSTDYFAFN